MRKYVIIFKTSLLTKLQYMGNLLGRVIVYTMIVFVLTLLWSYMYGDENTISGYSLNQMIWYVIMTELIWFSARSAFIRDEIAGDIKSGKIAYTLNKPYNYVSYVVFKHMGETCISYFVNIIIAVLTGILLIGPLTGFSVTYLPFIGITFILSTLIGTFVYLAIALSSFWVEENSPFIWIYEKFVLLLGVIFPVEVYPAWAQPIIRLTPIYTIFYAPARLTVAFSFNSWLSFTLMQGVHIGVFLIMIWVIYRKGVRKLNVNGG